MATDEAKPTDEDEDVAEWEQLCEHTPPSDVMRWRPDQEGT